MLMGEFATAVQYNLPIKVIIIKIILGRSVGNKWPFWGILSLESNSLQLILQSLQKPVEVKEVIKEHKEAKPTNKHRQ